MIHGLHDPHICVCEPIRWHCIIRNSVWLCAGCAHVGNPRLSEVSLIHGSWVKKRTGVKASLSSWALERRIAGIKDRQSYQIEWILTSAKIPFQGEHFSCGQWNHCTFQPHFAQTGTPLP